MAWLDTIAPDLTRTNDFFSDRWKRNDEDFKRGKNTGEPPPTDLTPGPTEVDYSTGFPLEYRKTGKELMDADLEKFQQTHPVPPSAIPQMAAQPAIPGLLGANIQGAMPPGVGEQPPAAPAGGGPAPALPPPVQVGAPPGGVPMGPATPPAGTPDAVAQQNQMPTDVSAQSRQPAPSGNMPQGAAPPQDTSGLLGRIDRLTQANPGLLFALAGGFAGAPSFGTGMRRAFGAAGEGMQLDQKMALQNSQIATTYRALVASGMPPQLALAAARNPAVLQQAAPGYIGSKGEIKTLTSKDSLGNETQRLVMVHPDGSVTELKGQGAAQGSGAGGFVGSTTGAGVSPDLAQMPVQIDPKTGRDENFAAAFKAADPINYTATENLLAGNMKASGRNLQQLQRYASRIDPDYSPANAGARQKLYESYYGGGEGYKALRSANTAIDHGMLLADAIKRLNNYSIAPDFLNPVTGKISEQYSKQYQAALKDFEANSEIYARELDVALTGKSTVSGQAEIRKLFDRYGSPDANYAALNRTLRMLNERVGEHENQYKTSIKSKINDPFHEMLTKRADLDRMIQNGAQNEGAPQASASAPRGGVQWRVVQP